MSHDVRAARSLRGVRRFVLPAALALATLAGSSPARAEKMEGGVPWRMGGRVGFTVDAFVVPDSSGLTLEVMLRVPPATVEQLSRDEEGRARLRADFRVKGRASGGPAEASQTFTLSPEDSVRGQGKVIVTRFAAAPGPCQVEVRLTDVLSHRRGALVPGGDANFSQVISGRLTIPAAQAGRDLSDIEFLWPSTDEAVSLAFVRAGRTVVPNPDRLYGLMAGEVRARFVARGKRGETPRSWHWVARVFDAHGRGIAQRESTTVASSVLDTDVAFDISSEPAGVYDLEVKAWQQGDAGALQRRSAFSVAWQPETWLRNATEVEDEVHFLLSASGEDQFITMPPGAQEQLLQEFWARRDPTPDTAVNEVYEMFRERIRHANETFTRIGSERGMFSDMGRVYIRYGEPSEVLRQVMPAGNETLTEQLQTIIDTETRMPDNIHSPGPGGDMRPYEVWIYEGDIPMPLDVDPGDPTRGRTSRRLVFLFVDQQGTGLFRLRYSTE